VPGHRKAGRRDRGGGRIATKINVLRGSARFYGVLQGSVLRGSARFGSAGFCEVRFCGVLRGSVLRSSARFGSAEFCSDEPHHRVSRSKTNTTRRDGETLQAGHRKARPGNRGGECVAGIRLVHSAGQNRNTDQRGLTRPGGTRNRRLAPSSCRRPRRRQRPVSHHREWIPPGHGSIPASADQHGSGMGALPAGSAGSQSCPCNPCSSVSVRDAVCDENSVLVAREPHNGPGAPRARPPASLRQGYGGPPEL
jgi:hypothetical protein